MAAPACSEEDFIQLFESLGPDKLAQQLSTNVRSIYKRRASIEGRIGRQIRVPSDAKGLTTRLAEPHPHRLHAEVTDGVVLVGGDGHYWPGPASTAHRAFVKVCKELSPKLVVMNGDAFDGARISRHPPIGWEKAPLVVQELEAVQERLGEIEMAVKSGVRIVWPLGNHDKRFETRLATVAPEYARINGFHLKDHVGPRWEPCWSLWINDGPDAVVVKHRPPAGGVHSTRNSTVRAGKTTVCNHLHSLKVTPFSDYSDRPRWGVDCGTLADPYGPQFADYTEDGPLDWRSGFVVLTFRKGVLLWPEIVHVFAEGKVEFRGQVYDV